MREINGQRAAEELASSLEKNDIINVKGNSIKWKRWSQIMILIGT
jgi:hypothetical protein